MEYTNEHIENFLKGKLNASDASNLENVSALNPKLKAQIAYEKIISSAVSSHRKMALKARLSNITVAPVGTSGSNILSMGSAVMKTAAAVVAGIGIGTGIYFYTIASKDEALEVSPASQKTEVLATIESVVELKRDAKEENINTKRPSSTTAADNSKLVKQKSVLTASIKKEPSKKLNKTVPNMLAFEDNSQADVSADVDDSPLSKKIESSIHRIFDIEIKTVTDSKYKFHYKLKDNILMLYGKFDASQYEILEFNSTSGANLYFFYNENYYSLKSNIDGVEKLKVISDKKTTSELNLARGR